jgi:hypothetical protein
MFLTWAGIMYGLSGSDSLGRIRKNPVLCWCIPQASKPVRWAHSANVVKLFEHNVQCTLMRAVCSSGFPIRRAIKLICWTVINDKGTTLSADRPAVKKRRNACCTHKYTSTCTMNTSVHYWFCYGMAHSSRIFQPVQISFADDATSRLGVK